MGRAQREGPESPVGPVHHGKTLHFPLKMGTHQKVQLAGGHFPQLLRLLPHTPGNTPKSQQGPDTATHGHGFPSSLPPWGWQRM